MKMRLRHLGTKPIKTITAVERREENFPEVRLSSHKIPDIKNMKVGDKCSLMFDAEVTGLRKSEGYEHHPEGTVHADFKLHKGNLHSSKGKSKEYHSSEEAYDDGIEELKDHEAKKRLSRKS